MSEDGKPVADPNATVATTKAVAKPARKAVGGFEIVLKLGQGGMGAVYKARQPLLNRIIALKVMAPHLSTNPAFVTRFIREACSAASLTHPNVVQVHTAGEDTGRYYIAMEFVEGESLQQRLKRAGAMPPAEAVAITLCVAEALNYAWKKAKLIHRDIKPDNIFLSNAGEVKLGDLGLAKNIGDDSAHVTATGVMMGTPHYMSPEQAQAEKSVDFRSDMYSLGCTLFHMLTGHRPYTGDSALSVAMKHVNEAAPSITQACPNCPHLLAKVVTRMMAKKAEDRYASYEDLIAELKKVHAALPKDDKAVAPATDGIPVRKDRRVLYGVTGLAALLLVGGLLLWAPWKSAPAPTGVVPPSPPAVPPTVAVEDRPPPVAPAPRATPVETAVSAAQQPRQTLDLLALTDPLTDRQAVHFGNIRSLANQWERRGTALVFVADGGAGQIGTPVALNARCYEMEVEFERLAGEGPFVVNMPLDEAHVIGMFFDNEKAHMIGGVRVGNLWPAQSGNRSRVIVRVERGQANEPDRITVRRDGQEIMDWRGNALGVAFSSPGHPGKSSGTTPGLHTKSGSYSVSFWQLRIYDGNAQVLRGEGAGAVTPGVPAVHAVPAPAPPEPVLSLTDYTPLFNGQSLTGWKPRSAGSNWSVQDGVLVNAQKGADLITTGTFTDFTLHLEYKLSPRGNSGVYLRGRYEVKLRDDAGLPLTTISSGGIAGQITPRENASKPANQWQTLDATVAGQDVTIMLNGQTVVEVGKLARPTVGALDQNVDEPGPIMLLGSFSAVSFRNLCIRPLKRVPPPGALPQ